jgi:hypothetical protein
MTKNNNSDTTKWRLIQLEKRVDDLDKSVSDLLENHLPHIQEELTSLKTRITILTAINIGAIVLAMLLNKYL